EKKSFPWWILIVVGILLVVGVVIGILIFRNGGDDPPTPTPEKVKVPPVNGKTFAEAEKELREAGFTVVKAEEIAADKPLDKVLKQDPNGEAEPNSKITLTIPAATTVPDLQGMCAGRAIDELLNRQLVPGVISGNKEKIINCEGQVFTTNPPANQLIAKGASVSLNVVCYPYVDSCSNFMASEILNSDKPVLRDPPNKNLFNFNNSNK
ncbi:MAG TPA: PASTA domain-containing protein, partial [Pyrinomonadaceae bacterium]|nr:PASTA domain-containing protein [Pyrinomonadaceae bacterium]